MSNDTSAPDDDKVPEQEPAPVLEAAPEPAPEPAYVPEHPRCGFVALVGAPNAGKSTLLNNIIGQKVSIVSPRVQTTRTRVLGIATEGDSQIVFIDTPGIFAPKKRLERAMVAAAWQGATDADLVVLLVDAARKSIDADTRAIIARLKDSGREAILALNKIDLIKRDKLLALATTLNAEGIFTDTFMISAETGDGVKDLRNLLATRMPEGPWHFPGDQLSDIPMRLLAAELVREKIFLQLYQELPYSATVEPEGWEEFDDGSVKISMVLYIERDSQKAIILGKGGQRIKQIGAAARTELEEMMERRVHLFLHVKVREEWTNDPERYKDWNLDYNA
jgi:GTPase